MRVAIVGGGALGAVVATRLARHAEVAIADAGVMEGAGAWAAARVTRVDGDGAADTFDPAAFARRGAGDGARAEAAVAIVTAAYGAVDAATAAARAAVGDGGAIVVLTALLPEDRARLAARFGGAVTAGMPGIAAYEAAPGEVRYWLPKSVETAIDAAGVDAAEHRRALVRAFVDAGMPARIADDAGAGAAYAATAMALAPVAIGVRVAGGVDALVGDAALLDQTLAAAREATAIAAHVGVVAAWTSALARFGNATMVKVGVALGRTRAPEAIAFAERHLAGELAAQNFAFATAAARIGEARGLAHGAIDDVVARALGHGSAESTTR